MKNLLVNKSLSGEILLVLPTFHVGTWGKNRLKTVRSYWRAHGTLLDLMWQPRWEGSSGENGYTCMYSWISLLFTWNYRCLPEALLIHYAPTKNKKVFFLKNGLKRLWMDLHAGSLNIRQPLGMLQPFHTQAHSECQLSSGHRSQSDKDGHARGQDGTSRTSAHTSHVLSHY